MIIFKVLSILLYLTITSVHAYTSQFKTCDKSLIGDCAFYIDCVEENLPCHQKGYALGYGHKYCLKFSNLAFSSEESVLWMNQTMSCLQLAIMDHYESFFSCKNLYNFAFESHPTCYLQPSLIFPDLSICKLPKRDILKIINTVDLIDLIKPEGREQIAIVARKCSLEFIGLDKNKKQNFTFERSQEMYLFWKNISNKYSKITEK